MKKSVAISLAVAATTVLSWAQMPDQGRDPFVDLSRKPVPLQTQDKTPKDGPGEIVGVGLHSPPAAPKADPMPTIDVRGILSSPGGSRAILTGPHRTFIVQQGDRLGDYRVANIDSSGVTLAFKNQRFHCPLKP